METSGSSVIAELLAQGHAVTFPARGDSMDPLVREHDILHVEPLEGGPPRRGEIVLAAAPRGLTAHRVVEIRDGLITLRGDNAAESDPPLRASCILGRVTRFERNGRSRRVRTLSGAMLEVARLVDRCLRRMLR